MTKIDIISGFLGAGKTTLIKKLIEEGFKGEKLVLIENEFGEIGIDGGFLKDAGVQITEMNSGCICCSLVGDFGTALKKVITEYAPDRIIIEPSGVGKLSDVIKAVKDVAEEVEVQLDSYTTVADVSKCKIYMKNFGEFFNNQIESANTIVLSRTQTASQDKIEKAVAMIREHNADATIITTPWDDIDGSKIKEAMQNHKTVKDALFEDEDEHEHHHLHHDHDDECGCGDHDHDHEHHHHDHDDECGCGCHDHDHEHHHHDHDDECSCGCHDHDHHHHHHADEVFTSWGKETPHKFTREKIEEVLKTLSESEEYGMILRAKGMVEDVNGSWIYFDMVPGEYELRDGEPDYTGRLCVIGSKIDEHKIEELFGIA